MKVLWIVLGVLFGLCLLCGGGFYFLFSKGKALLDDAHKFGDSSFTSIASSWDLQTFKTYAAPELEEQVGSGPMGKLMETFKEKLGPLKGTIQSHLTGIHAENNNGVSATTAEWDADATFEKGQGHATMELISRNGKWQILKLHIESAALLSGSGGGDAPAPNGETR